MNVKSDCCNILIYDPFNVKIKLKIQAYKPKYHNLIKDACCNHTAGHWATCMPKNIGPYYSY